MCKHPHHDPRPAALVVEASPGITLTELRKRLFQEFGVERQHTAVSIAMDEQYILRKLGKSRSFIHFPWRKRITQAEYDPLPDGGVCDDDAHDPYWAVFVTEEHPGINNTKLRDKMYETADVRNQTTVIGMALDDGLITRKSSGYKLSYEITEEGVAFLDRNGK